MFPGGGFFFFFEKKKGIVSLFFSKKDAKGCSLVKEAQMERACCRVKVRKQAIVFICVDYMVRYPR